jgi:hypothetical protein
MPPAGVLNQIPTQARSPAKALVPPPAKDSADGASKAMQTWPTADLVMRRVATDVPVKPLPLRIQPDTGALQVWSGTFAYRGLVPDPATGDMRFQRASQENFSPLKPQTECDRQTAFQLINPLSNGELDLARINEVLTASQGNQKATDFIQRLIRDSELRGIIESVGEESK